MLDPKDISKIGIGTWGIGGFMEKDQSVDAGKQRDAMAYMLAQGINFLEANYWYAQGYSVEILAKAITASAKKREDLFICQAIYLLGDKNLEAGRVELEKVMDILGTDYIDTVQFRADSFQWASFAEITDWIAELLATKRIRYTSITNASLSLLQRYRERFPAELFSHEVGFNFEIRANEEAGVIKYGEDNNIKTVVSQPLRRNRTAARNWKPVVDLAKKYHKSQNQILLNWICSKGYLPLTKSETIAHIDEHLAALSFEMEGDDLDVLNNYKIQNYTPPQIDWEYSGQGVSTDQLSNVFDELYDQQNQL